ncbi:MAG: putative 4-hydroxybenzoate polyprenyltransferase [Gemmatimonadaceae bacterium]
MTDEAPGRALPSGAREGQTFAGSSRLALYANLVKLPHTVFALPFALVGATLATTVRPVTLGQVGWIFLAFTAARFAAMAFNRVVDRAIDARNPRTATREIPSGRIGVTEAAAAVAAASVLFVVSAAELNRICLMLSPVALAWVLFYSVTKRFTRWSHLALGLGLAIAPVGGYLAVAGRWSSPAWMLAALALAVTTWVAGFDILYALQDAEFDRASGLYSVPAVLGEGRSFALARLMHAATILCLAAVGVAVAGGALYWLGVTVSAALLVYEHSLVGPGEMTRLDAAFFTMNGVISIVFFVFVLSDRLMRPLALVRWGST